MQPWVRNAGRIRVEHLPMPHPGARVDWAAPPKGLLHTIEGSLESGLAVFRKHYSPTFTIGRDRKNVVRIYQHIPLGYMAAALKNRPGGVETNRVCRVQIELAGYSRRKPWLPDPGVQLALANLMALLSRKDVCDIPLRHLELNRNAKLWDQVAGWYGHDDVPENDHWDPGALMWSHVLDLARTQAVALGFMPVRQTTKRPRKTDKVRTIPVKRAAKKARPADLCGGASGPQRSM